MIICDLKYALYSKGSYTCPENSHKENALGDHVA